MHLKYQIINKVGNILMNFGYGKSLLDINVLIDKGLTNEMVKKSNFDLEFAYDIAAKNEGLKSLLRSLKNDANLNFIGRWAAFHSISNNLRGRLVLNEAIKENEDILNETIVSPIVITGLPRTGTSILHQLLALDDQFATFNNWEANISEFYQFRKGLSQDQCIRNYETSANVFRQIIPDIDKVHELKAEFPQECIYLFGLNFNTLLFELLFHIPNYSQWMHDRSESEILNTLDIHKKALQYFQYENKSSPWLLKTPEYITILPQLIKQYPDVRIINTHRHPLPVFNSLIDGHDLFQTAYSKSKMNKETLEKVVVRHWEPRLKKYLEVRNSEPELIAKQSIFDLDFAILMENPIAQIEKIYAFFQLELTGTTIERMKTHLKSRPRYTHGKRSYKDKKASSNLQNLLGSKVFETYIQEYIASSKNYE